ncbi:helix-turn-helix domain-containing protein [Bordetella petrii]|uniref:helix-turn-helix domain-containing protein n=1 Tax=Bordetella petrii TaxID=94624 RepID=UPI000685648C|nr:helix-turn-helix transcriptional regulator [Bordetella petrii]
MKTFSDRLKHARVLRQHTQQSLARACGLSQSTIASYENGERRSSRSLRKIAQVLRVESEWLETGNGPIDRRTVYTAPDTPAPAGSKVMEGDAPGSPPPLTPWPFPSVAPSQVNALPASARRELDKWLRMMVDGYLQSYGEARRRKGR